MGSKPAADGQSTGTRGGADRIGTRTPLVAGLFVESLATLGYLTALGAGAPELWFLGARVTWGVGSAVVFATAYTIAADVSDGGSRGTSMGVVRGGITFGFPFGLVLGGVLSELYSIPTAFAVAAGFALAASVVAYALVPETHVSGHRTAVRPWELDTTAGTLAVGAVNFGLFFVYIGVLFATLVQFVDVNGISVWGYGPQGMSGLLMGGTVVSGSVFMLGGGKLSDVYGSRTPILLLFLGVAFFGFVLLAAAESLLVLIAACLCIGAGQGGTSGPLLALLADMTPDERMGRAMGTNNILGDLGGGLGPLVALPVVDVVGFFPLYVASAAVPLVAGGALLGGLYVQTGRLDPRPTRPADD